MNKEEFKKLFESALETAVVNAEKAHKVSLPRNFEIEFRGMAYPKGIIDVGTALDRLYLGDDLFIYVADIGVIGASSTFTRFFVGVSGHSPRGSIEETWNDPPGLGPFKPITPFQLKKLTD